MLLVWALSVSAAGACSQNSILNLEVLVPAQGPDPFEGVSKVTIKAGDKETSASIEGATSHFDTKVTLALGTQTTVSLEGRDDTGRLICSGSTPQLYAVKSSGKLMLWVSRQGAWSLHPEGLDQAMMHPATATYEQPVWETLDHQPLYTFWFGGCDSAGLPIDSVGYFDPYFQVITGFSGLGNQDAWSDPATPVRPRCGAVAMSLPDGSFLIYGGQDDAGLPTDELDLAVAKTSDFQYTPIPLECADGIDNDQDGTTDGDDVDCASKWDATESPDRDWALAFSRVVTLGPYASIWKDSSHKLLTSFLILGGKGIQGPSSQAIHLLAETTSDGLSYRFETEPMEMLAPRVGHCAAAGQHREGDTETRSVLVFGGTSDASGPAAEYFQFQHDTSGSAMDWTWTHKPITEDDQGDPLPNLTGSACTEVAQGRILVCGGTDDSGEASQDCWLFLPADGSIEHIPGVLGNGRFRLSLVRQGDLVLAVGGEDASGDFVTDSPVLSVQGTDVTSLGSIPMNGGLEGAGAFVLANGQPALLGGVDASGNLLDTFWIANVRAEDLAQ